MCVSAGVREAAGSGGPTSCLRGPRQPRSCSLLPQGLDLRIFKRRQKARFFRGAFQLEMIR